MSNPIFASLDKISLYFFRNDTQTRANVKFIKIMSVVAKAFIALGALLLIKGLNPMSLYLDRKFSLLKGTLLMAALSFAIGASADEWVNGFTKHTINKQEYEKLEKARQYTEALRQAPFVTLLKEVGMSNDVRLTYESINKWAQENLLRPRDQERWQVQESRFNSLEGKLTPIFKELGFTNEVTPSFKYYNGALVLGASMMSVCIRINYLVEQWKKGIRFEQIYLLTGDRKLEQNENKEKLLTCPFLKFNPNKLDNDLGSTEIRMIEQIWDALEIPPEMCKIPTYFIHTPKKANGNRPDTNDTVVAWLKAKPKSRGRLYMIVSNAPYIRRQDLAVRTVANTYSEAAYNAREMEFDAVGPETTKSSPAIILDEIARYVFQLGEFQNSLPQRPALR